MNATCRERSAASGAIQTPLADADETDRNVREPLVVGDDTNGGNGIVRQKSERRFVVAALKNPFRLADTALVVRQHRKSVGRKPFGQRGMGMAKSWI